MEHTDESVGRKELVLLGSVAMFVAALVVSAITASKLWSVTIPLLDYQIVIPVGTSLFGVTFLCTDVVAEVWGKRMSYLVVLLGLIARLLMVGFFWFAILVEPVSFWEGQEQYEAVLGGTFLIFGAGLLAYCLSQTNDVFVFHYLKERDEGKNRLWKRNNLSTFSSQFLDSFVFVVVAFGPSETLSVLISMILGQVVLKWAIAMIDTPLVYVVRNFATGRRILDFQG